MKNWVKQFVLLCVVGGYTWVTWNALHPTLPSDKTPLIFYSNQLHDDLRMVYTRAIQKAKYSISLQIYGLTDQALISLLCDKKREGLDVSITYDKGASKNLPKHLNARGSKCKGLMHRKILIIDDIITLVGTANLTNQSLKMHDNLVVGTYSPHLAKFFNKGNKSDPISIGKTTIYPYYFPDSENQAYEALENVINSAEKTIQIAMFTLTHKGLIKKLTEAQKRGVKIFVAIDRYTAKGASRKAIDLLKENGAEILLSQGSQLLHHKWALIDEKILAMGSANWTKAAFEKNEDCLLLFEELETAQVKIFSRLWKAVAIASKNG